MWLFWVDRNGLAERGSLKDFILTTNPFLFEDGDVLL